MLCLDWSRQVARGVKDVAYLARYAPGLGDTRTWSIRELERYTRAVSEIVEKENKPSNND